MYRQQYKSCYKKGLCLQINHLTEGDYLMKSKKRNTIVLSVVVGSFLIAQTAFAYSMDRSTWPNLSQGSSGGFVGSLQADLWSSGLSATVGTIDHSFGSATKNAVKSYQTAEGLTSDGSVGPGTKSKLESYTTNLSPTSRMYRNSGSTTYQTYYSLTPDGAGGQSLSYYLEYRSNGALVKSGTVFSE